MKQIKVNPNNEQFYSKEFIRGFNLGAERQYEADVADMPKWIPCSERLPLHGSRVLVTATHKKLGHTAVDVLRYHGDKYGWENSDFCTVNAWMPLPDPWKEGESNG